MSLIEQAAKRLEELRRSGAAPSDEQAATSPAAATANAGATPTPEALVLMLEARNEASQDSPSVPHVAASTSASHASQARRRNRMVGTGTRSVVIDLEGLKARGFVTPDAPRSQIADEFRVLKRPIILNATGKSGARLRDGNLVMVTSALPKEGKTFIAINLALSMAMEYDCTVLLVDGDVAHPGLPGVLGIHTSPGLLDLLTRDDIEMSDALLKTNVEKLSILPAGSRHHRATELLASEQMTGLLRELASRYTDRIVIFDSPPLLPTTEARVLASHMGQVVMVVAADATNQNMVSRALATIENCENVFMMLNKAGRTDVGTYYGYYGDEASA